MVQKGKVPDVCIVAYGDEAVSISIVELGETPYITIGSVKEVTATEFTVQDVEYYDYVDEEWLESSTNESITFVVNTLITKNGNFARSSEIEKDQEVVIIRKDVTSPAAVILLTE